MLNQLDSGKCHWIMNLVYMMCFVGIGYVDIEILHRVSWWIFFSGFAFCVNGYYLFEKVDSILNDKLVERVLEEAREERENVKENT